jgi:hypothetical protein
MLVVDQRNVNGPKLIIVGIFKGPNEISVGHIIGPKFMMLHTGNGPNSIIVGNVGKLLITIEGNVGRGPKSIIVGNLSGPKLIVLQKLGKGPKVIIVGIGGSTTIIDGILIGPNGPMSKQGNTIGGG